MNHGNVTAHGSQEEARDYYFEMVMVTKNDAGMVNNGMTVSAENATHPKSVTGVGYKSRRGI